MIEAERWVWRIAIVCAALGILFALMKNSPGFALFDAGMGAWFTRQLLTTK